MTTLAQQLELVREANAEVLRSVRAMERATAARRRAILAAADAGHTFREIGEVLGISPQRVHQIARYKGHRSPPEA